MSKLSATRSIVIAFFVGVVGAVVGVVGTVYVLSGGPPTNDGNPIGFRLQSNVVNVIPTGSPPSASALQACSKKPSCNVQIDLRMPRPSSLPSPTPPDCPKPEQCFQFTGQVQLSSYDWKGSPHPADAAKAEPRYAAGTIYISDK